MSALLLMVRMARFVLSAIASVPLSRYGFFELDPPLLYFDLEVLVMEFTSSVGLDLLDPILGIYDLF